MPLLCTYAHYNEELRKEKEQLLHLNKILSHWQSKKKKKQFRKQAELHLVQPLKPLNGYHPLRKLTFLPANTCAHSYNRNGKISSPEKHFGMCLTHKLQVLQSTSARVFIHLRQARPTAPCWTETEGAVPHRSLIRSKAKEVLVPHRSLNCGTTKSLQACTETRPFKDGVGEEKEEESIGIITF